MKQVNVEDLSFSYPETEVLKDVFFSVPEGSCTAVLGTNGAGKSTLLKCINRILRQQKGVVEVSGEDIRKLDGNRLARKIGYVAQQNRFSETTVFDAVLLGRKPYIKWDAGEEDLQIVEEIMDRLSLSPYAMRAVTRLSGGEMQKVAIARALAQQPELLLFDEPTSNLDLKNQLEVIGIIRAIVDRYKISAIVTMHDLNLALRFADRFLLVRDGTVFKAGGEEILTPENIRQTYGIDVILSRVGGRMVVVPV